MSSLGNREVMSANIRRYMKANHVNRKELSAALKTPYTTVSDWINGKTYPRIDKIEMMAKFFGIEKKDLVEKYSLNTSASQGKSNDETLPPGSQIAPDLTELSRIPVLGHTACGSPIPAIREYDYACVNRALKADFALVAEGKSMTGCGIMDGSLVLFQKTESVDNGTIAAVTVGDATTIKKFYQYGDTVVLKPCNPDYPEQEYTEEELDSIHVFGQIIACLTDYSC